MHQGVPPPVSSGNYRKFWTGETIGGSRSRRKTITGESNHKALSFMFASNASHAFKVARGSERCVGLVDRRTREVLSRLDAILYTCHPRLVNGYSMRSKYNYYANINNIQSFL